MQMVPHVWFFSSFNPIWKKKQKKKKNRHELKSHWASLLGYQICEICFIFASFDVYVMTGYETTNNSKLLQLGLQHWAFFFFLPWFLRKIIFKNYVKCDFKYCSFKKLSNYLQCVWQKHNKNPSVCDKHFFFSWLIQIELLYQQLKCSSKYLQFHKRKVSMTMFTLSVPIWLSDYLLRFLEYLHYGNDVEVMSYVKTTWRGL